MTGATCTDEKMPRTPVSPTNTDTSTLHGDAFIEIGEVDAPSSRPSSAIHPTASEGDAQPENNPNGFPRLAAFQASDPNFGLYRSYSYLHSRILLDLQSEITELEDELDHIDWDENDEDEDRPKCRATEAAEGEAEDARTRRVVLREIKAKLMEYGTS
ncbi:hypothetical protein N0V94_003959 [Neodidymelliopsis sp. IMI 364377]|nr:hypothetical protein N0V94_003959 [Neodidymelliopsis sp. IMI 364377]